MVSRFLARPIKRAVVLPERCDDTTRREVGEAVNTGVNRTQTFGDGMKMPQLEDMIKKPVMRGLGPRQPISLSIWERIIAFRLSVATITPRIRRTLTAPAPAGLTRI